MAFRPYNRSIRTRGPTLSQPRAEAFVAAQSRRAVPSLTTLRSVIADLGAGRVNFREFGNVSASDLEGRIEGMEPQMDADERG